MNTHLIFDSTFVQALGWTVLHSIWQGTLVAISLVLVLGMIKKEKAELRYGFSVMALLAMLLWSASTFWQHIQADTITSLLPHSGEVWIVGQVEPAFVATQEISESPITFLLMQLESNLHWIFAAWLIGFAAFSSRWIGSMIYLHRLRHRHAFTMEGPVVEQAQRLAEKLGIRTAVTLLESAKVHTPMVLGHLKPAILLPAGMLTGLAPEQIEAILAHELAHIQRHDYLVNLMQSLVEIVFFYHPAYWWVTAQIRDEREHCCDDVAVSTCGSALLYARALTDLEAQRLHSHTLAVGLVGRKKHLLARIRRIMAADGQKSHLASRILSLTILSLSLLSVAWLSPPEPAPEPPTWPDVEFEGQGFFTEFDGEPEVNEFGEPEIVAGDLAFGIEGIDSMLAMDEWLIDLESGLLEARIESEIDLSEIERALAEARIEMERELGPQSEWLVLVQNAFALVDTPPPPPSVLAPDAPAPDESAFPAMAPFPDMPEMPEFPELPALPELPAIQAPVDSATAAAYQQAYRAYQEQFTREWQEKQRAWQQEYRQYQMELQQRMKEQQRRQGAERRSIIQQQLAELKIREHEMRQQQLDLAREQREQSLLQRGRMAEEQKRLLEEQYRRAREADRQVAETKRQMEEQQRMLQRELIERKVEMVREQAEAQRLFAQSIRESEELNQLRLHGKARTKQLLAHLRSDGLIGPNVKSVKITSPRSGKLKVNGKRIPPELQGKYRELIHSTIPEFSRSESIIISTERPNLFDFE